MKKSGDDIEADFFLFIKEMSFDSFIRGELYREGMRPMNAKTEDAVVTFKTGLDGQFQDGEVVLNVYVPDIYDNGIYTKDIIRCRQIGAKIAEIIDTFTNAEYLVSLINIPQSFQAEEINQHFVNARIKFKRKNS